MDRYSIKVKVGNNDRDTTWQSELKIEDTRVSWPMAWRWWEHYRWLGVEKGLWDRGTMLEVIWDLYDTLLKSDIELGSWFPPSFSTAELSWSILCWKIRSSCSHLWVPTKFGIGVEKAPETWSVWSKCTIAVRIGTQASWTRRRGYWESR